MIRMLSAFSIKQKLTMVMMLTIFAGVVLMGVFFMGYERIQSREQLAHEVTVITKVSYSQVAAALEFEDLNTLQESANSLDYDYTIDVVCIYDGDLVLQARSFPGSVRAIPCPDNPHADPSGFVQDKYHHIEDVFSESERIGTIFISANMDYVNSQIQRYFYMMLTALGIISVVSLLVAMVLQKAVTDPIFDLAQTATSIANNRDFSLRAAKTSDDEIGQMVDAFNEMLTAIQQRDQELQSHKTQLESKVEERTAELQAANQELEAFSYSVSHDLRSPLRAIDGFSQALLEDYADQLDSAALGYLERVRMASQRMGTLIDSMLWLSRVTRQEIVTRTVNFSLMCEEVVQDIQDRDPSRQVKVTVQPEMSMRCDSRLMRLVISNLVDNAFKYTLKVAAPEVSIGCKEGIYYVKDNGAGFDMRYSDKLFGVFQRLHSKDEFEGTGVGLATVARVIQRHGGDIWAESEVNRGATFFFTVSA
ncbi:MAG: histidine kinase [Pseudomonadales bacterium]|nr:histidine kinase [Pseudomonadales bacterium]